MNKQADKQGRDPLQLGAFAKDPYEMFLTGFQPIPVAANEPPTLRQWARYRIGRALRKVL